MKYVSFMLLFFVFSFALADVTSGDAAVAAGDYQKAIDEYTAALETSSDNAFVLIKLAEAKTSLAETLTGQVAESLYVEAADHVRAALVIEPENADAHVELARALGRLAQFKGVLQSLGLANEVKNELEQAVALNPNHAAALHGLAMWHLEVPWIAGGRSTQVRPLFDKAIASEPHEITHYVDYAGALIRLGDKKAAKTQLEAALALTVESYRDRQDQAKAQQMLSEFLQ